MRVACEGLV